jgi:hypothetical protein
MQIYYTSNRYGTGDAPKFNDNFDYLLFRQDWGGNESVFFNKDEIDDVSDKIANGDIPIHMNYSLLFCGSQELMDFIDGQFGCYALVNEKK